ncbi:MAG: putative HMP/thiamine import ATP-binding protein YkoD [Firmicutes bacterium ADurb.Bin193]|nr:MAG: putative HMP/thiamine import ATP-binding protein YkoD [Firmicutes bacterium ADurb.Bin193]
MIEIDNLTFQYNNSDRPALKDICLHVEKGGFTGIIGPSGAGKSTLTYCINGVVPHYLTGDFYGSVRVCGLDTVDNGCMVLSRHVGSVFQDPESQIVTSVVEDEIAFGLENFNTPYDEMEKRITESLEMADISHLRHRDTAGLSGGQKQRVAIATAIALRPEVLVLDEPTSELDPEGSASIFETLSRLNHEYGMTIVIVEQKVMLLSKHSKRLIVMQDGRIVLDGMTREVLRHSEKLVELGINCPRVVELAGKLSKNGLYQGDCPTDVDEAYTMVTDILRRQK